MRNVEGARNLMRMLGMLSGPRTPTLRPTWIDRAQVLTANVTGTWHASVDRGATVTAGQVLGQVTDYFGNAAEQVRAPFAGTVLYVIGSPAISEGEPVAFVGHVQGTGAISGGPDTVSFPSGNLTLRGVLWKPTGRGPFPAIMYSHGSGNDYTAASRGAWGVLSSAGLRVLHAVSSGLGTVVERGAVHPRCAGQRGARVGAAGPQREDGRVPDRCSPRRRDGGGSVVTHPAVCRRASRGGIGEFLWWESVSQLLASRDIGLRAAINSAGAAQTWSQSSHLRAALLDAAAKARVPVLLMQAENDYDLTPSRQIAEAMTRAGHAHEVQFFPPFGSNTAEGHSFGYFGSLVWGERVSGFLKGSMK